MGFLRKIFSKNKHEAPSPYPSRGSQYPADAVRQPPPQPQPRPSSTPMPPSAPVPAGAMALFSQLLSDRAVMAKFLVLDRIEFQNSLQRGAHGQVWVAVVHGERVAVKRMADKVEREDVLYFIGEIKLTASLNHPNVIRYRGVAWGSTEASLCMAIDLHAKGDLFTLLQRFGASMSWTKDKKDIAVGVASALEYLHERTTPIIHRDVKAKNVLLSDAFAPVLTDFGVSRDRALESMTAGVGTPYWVAPELLQGTKYDERSDIYSFGVFLSELDTCQVPYHGAKDQKSGRELRPMQILQLVLQNNIAPSFTPEWPKDILAVARRCLDHNPSNRPSARELVALLQGNTPGAAPPRREVTGNGMPPVPSPVMSSLTTDPAVSGQWLAPDRLSLVRVLTRSAFGEVWFGTLDGQSVAIKRLLQSDKTNLEDVILFVGEVKLTASLSHPNIIRFRGLSWGTAVGSLCMAMDYHEKADLEGFLRNSGSLMTWENEKLKLAVGLGSALAYLHDRATPIIHRDIRAKNVLSSASYDAVLIDFGVSRDRAEEAMTAGVGTPYWVAPEMLQGKKYDERSDVYSFGVFMSELDTCLPPYHGAKDERNGKDLRPLQVLNKILEGSLKPSFTPDCPQHVLTIAQRCLEREPANRPSSRDLANALQGRIVLPPPGPAPSAAAPMHRTPSPPPMASNRFQPAPAPPVNPPDAGRDMDPALEPLKNDPAVFSQFIPFQELGLERQLNRIGHGEVWYASLRGKPVALKRLKQEKVDREDIGFFISEIKLTASLNHPNVIRYRGVSWTSSAASVCMIMDYHSKGDLAQMLKRNGSMMRWKQDKLGIAVGIANALQYLHELKPVIMHRDVKAKNVLLSERFDGILTDFGVGRDRAQETMTAGVGTPYWVAPEILKGIKYDEQSDIYSFGVFLAELDTCQMPYFDAKDDRIGKDLRPMQILQMVLTNTITPSFSPDCPRHILDIARRCLQHNADQRPTARELVSALQDTAAPAPAPARPIDPPAFESPSPATPSFQKPDVASALVPPVPDPVMEPLRLDRAVCARWVPFERLNVERPLSRGAHGEVVVASMTGDYFAVKRLQQSDKVDREDLSFFVAEIKLTASLNHPNVIGYRGVTWSTTAMSLYMLMDYHPKGDLLKLLQKYGSMLSWSKDKQSLAAGVASGLEYLHDRTTPIIHRDVKAKNVLVSDDFVAVLTDFGVSRDRAQETMTAGVGTPFWVAPELLQGDKYDEKSDIYSFGVFLSELDTCQVPYHDAKDERTGRDLRPMQILQQVMQGQLKPSFSRDCPQPILDLARRCLEYNPDDRPSARELVVVLRGSSRGSAHGSSRGSVHSSARGSVHGSTHGSVHGGSSRGEPMPQPPRVPTPPPRVPTPPMQDYGRASQLAPVLPAVPDPLLEPLRQDRAVAARWIPFERLQVVRSLARGAFGEVCLASLNGRNVALKRLVQSDKIDRQEVAYFVAEIKLTASLQHPNIIGYVGVSWSSSSVSSLVMAIDYHSRGDLEHILKKYATMMTWVQDKLGIAVGIASALEYLHDRETPIIHRDVKAKNMLVSDAFVAVLTDFGVSRDRDQETMTAGVGTPYWVAPELLEGVRYDEKSDIYSFGVFLSELDTCQMPYHDAKDERSGKELRPLQILQLVMQGKLTPSFSRDCPSGLVALARRCLQRNPMQRPSARELVDALRRTDVRPGY